MIIDIHARLIRNTTDRTYMVKELLKDMELNGIARRWVSTFDGESIQDQNDIIIDICKEHSCLEPCISLNPKVDSSLHEIERIWKRQPFKMVELDPVECCYYPEVMAFNLIPLLKQCEEKDIVVKLAVGTTYRGAPDSWVKYFKQFPKIKFIIEHMGAGDYQYGTVSLCKEFDNLYLETSMACEKPAVLLALRELDISKVMFGSNYPDYMTKLELLKFKDYGISKENMQRILYKNAEEILLL